MSNMKKLITGVAAVVLSVSSAVGASALEWRIKGYDTSVLEKEAFGTYRVGVVYEQYDDNGLSTGVVVDAKTAELYGLKPYATATFTAPETEKAWPNRQYFKVLADGVNTGKVLYNGVKEQLQYRNANYLWELSAPHRIYQATQAFIPGIGWYTDNTYPGLNGTLIYAGDVATVQAEYSNYYGFGMWEVKGNSIAYMPYSNPALVNYTNTDSNLYYDDGYGAVAAYGALNANAVTNLTGHGAKSIDVKKSFSLVVAGPKFNFDGSVSKGNEFANVKSAASVEGNILPNFGVNELVKHVYSYDGSCATMKTEWIDAGFEREAPYRYFQILKVDDVLLDGRYVAPGVNRPYVYRYVVGPDGNPATANVSVSYTYALNEKTPAAWNATAGKFEFLVDVTEHLFYNGVELKPNRVVHTAYPSNVFGQINYNEKWENGRKIIYGTLEGKPLHGNEIYRAKFLGSVNDVIDWGNLTITSLDAGLDYNYGYADDIVVPAAK